MGSTLSSVHANLHMKYFKAVLHPAVGKHLSPWLRYVDDIFALWSDNSSLFQPFPYASNNLAPSVMFNAERESNTFLPFLDMHVHRSAIGFPFCHLSQWHIHSMLFLTMLSLSRSVLVSPFLRGLRSCDPQYLRSL